MELLIVVLLLIAAMFGCVASSRLTFQPHLGANQGWAYTFSVLGSIFFLVSVPAAFVVALLLL